MKYSILIRKLIQASKQAISQKKDIANLLKERCLEDSDIIRQMLMNAVCDPRFRIHIQGVENWTNLAKEELEALAIKLQSTPNLNQEIALNLLNDMLSTWFKENIYEIERKKIKKLEVFQIGQEIKPSLNKLINNYVNNKKEDTQDKSGRQDKEEDTQDKSGRQDKENQKKLNWSGKESDDAFGLKKTNKSEKKTSSTEKGYEATNDEIEIENEFLKNVPPSLIKLAKKIGRSSNQNDNKSSKFLHASKSDIAGITIGNNLNCILPSEIALLADKQTENIFYKNYITKNLQLFASQSSSNQSKKHHEGPIIICLDTSSSMIGEPMLVAKALTFALCIIAQRKKRKVIVVKYSNDYQTYFLNNIEKQKKELNDFIAISFSGGNDENKMFTGLFRDILPNSQKEYQSADTVCISDFGWCPIDEQTMQIIKKEKEKNMKFYALNVDNNNDKIFKSNSDSYDPEKVCDSLWEYKNGICVEIKK